MDAALANRQAHDQAIAAGYEALAGGGWDAARERFELALSREESAAAWEGLGWAGWWLADEELTLRARERAYSVYRAEANPGGAARVAAWLAADFAEFSGRVTVGRGWLERARRLLENVPAGPDHGWLAVHEGHFALSAGDTGDAVGRARLAARLGRAFGVADLEAIGLAQEGIALVASGEVEDGMRRLDEASAMVAGEGLEPACVAWSLCYLISACAGVGDFPRAGHWCEAMRAWAERWGTRSFLGVCRVSYGRVLGSAGRWDAAESELAAAVADFEAARPAMAATGLVRLADLRIRQGRAEEARVLYERAIPYTPAVTGLGQIALDDGDLPAARDAAERVLRRLPAHNVLDRLPALELLVRTEIAAGDLGSASAGAAELGQNAQKLGTPYLVGRFDLIAGELAIAAGDADEARRRCEDAGDRFDETSAPYEAALARLVLASALLARGRVEAAETAAAAALETFATLGAARDVARAEAFLAGRTAGTPGGGSLGDLTPRELEVLRLVAKGLSDAEIAERLVVSPHTVHRHVANVRTKLRLPSRAAAVAFAARAGLL